MEPYWEKEFCIEDKKYEIKLYQYTPKCIAMTSTEDFGKKFATPLKEIGGKFNPKLSIGPSWIFKFDFQSDLTDVLRKIYKGEIKPKETEIRQPVFEDSDVDQKIFNNLQELITLLPEEKEERILSETEEVITTVYYNKDEETVTKGNLIYSFCSAHKNMEIYQLEL
tara:strand:- start:95 stop:595 length:501 start_codon:yes stop_codon:yes gene_type:complete